MQLVVDNRLSLQLVDECHIDELYKLINDNREHLRQWLPWVDRMENRSFIVSFIENAGKLNKAGKEFAFVIFLDNVMVGRIGIYKIDDSNKTGEIGYWIAAKAQGQNIITRACERILRFCFENLHLNRIEIKCAADNVRSEAIPQKLGFVYEGLLREAEQSGENKFTDLKLYSSLRRDRE